MQSLTRRDFLKLLGGGAALVVLPVLSGCGADGGGPQPLIAATPAPGTTALGPLPERLITPTADLYKQYYRSIASVNRDSWRFKISGSVVNPVELSYADFLDLPQTSAVTTMECIGNAVGGTQIGNIEWTGVLWSDLQPLYKGARPNAVEWRFTCADGYITTLPIERIAEPNVLLAHAMNGAPLPEDHGAPLRIIIPGKYGQKQPKWLLEMAAIRKPELGFWENRGWSNVADIQLHSMVRQIIDQRVNSGAASAAIPLGPAVVAGVALDGYKRIARVEVSTDNGTTWNDAEINHPPTPHEWTLWQYLWNPPAAGAYRVTARAYDEAGNLQFIGDDDGSDGQTRNFVTKVTVG